MEKEQTINEALGLSQNWRDSKQDEVSNYFMESDLSTLSDIMEQVALDTKLEEFGDPGSAGYELTAYEKKLVYCGFMINQEFELMKSLAAKKELMSDMIKAILGKSKGKDEPGLSDLYNDIFGPKDGE